MNPRLESREVAALITTKDHCEGHITRQCIKAASNYRAPEGRGSWSGQFASEVCPKCIQKPRNQDDTPKPVTNIVQLSWFFGFQGLHFCRAPDVSTAVRTVEVDKAHIAIVHRKTGSSRKPRAGASIEAKISYDAGHPQSDSVMGL